MTGLWVTMFIQKTHPADGDQAYFGTGAKVALKRGRRNFRKEVADVL